MLSTALLQRVSHAAKNASAVTMGRVVRVAGLLIEAFIPGARVGDLIEIERGGGRVTAEVVGFRDAQALVIPMGDIRGVGPGARVHACGQVAEIPAGLELLGRVIDPFGNPIDSGPGFSQAEMAPIEREPPLPQERLGVSQRFDTGVRIIDGLLTCGRGQRVGLFAGAGVGKTVLIRQIAEQSSADVTIVGLVGERGCEVPDVLSSSMRKKACVVVATSDKSPMERVRGARAATALAEHFRDQGKNVLLIIDSLTRYAMALREIGLAAGEPPATKGYPPSVFAALPRLLERVAPVASGGSITAFYTVLVEGDDLSDPVADSARSLLDGHIVMSRDLAARGHFPAVDVLASASRVMRAVTTPEAQALANRSRGLLATRREVEELRSLGAYVPGANPAYDEALALAPRLDSWMAQATSEKATHETAMAGLAEIMKLRSTK